MPGLRWPRKKPQHKLTLGRGWRGSIFPKTDYLPSPRCSLALTFSLSCSLSLSETSCSLGSCFDNADPQAQGVGVYMYGWGYGGGGSLIQEPSTCKSAQKHASFFFFHRGPRMLKLSSISTQHQCQMPDGNPTLSERPAFCWSAFRSMARRVVVFFQV